MLRWPGFPDAKSLPPSIEVRKGSGADGDLAALRNAENDQMVGFAVSSYEAKNLSLLLSRIGVEAKVKASTPSPGPV